MFPINYSYVSPFDIHICDKDGNTQTITVLSLDKAKNDEYWKVLTSFSNFIQAQGLTEPTQANQWLISTAFEKLEGFQDLMQDMQRMNPYAQKPQLYGIDIEFVEDDKLYAVLQLADESLVENELWKPE